MVSKVTNHKVPPRVLERPAPETRREDELKSLAEAAALFWPDGPLTVTSLRTAVRDGLLDVAEIAGKILTTRAAIRRMCECRPRSPPNARDSSDAAARARLAVRCILPLGSAPPPAPRDAASGPLVGQPGRPNRQ